MGIDGTAASGRVFRLSLYMYICIFSYFLVFWLCMSLRSWLHDYIAAAVLLYFAFKVLIFVGGGTVPSKQADFGVIVRDTARDHSTFLLLSCASMSRGVPQFGVRHALAVVFCFLCLFCFP